MDVNIEFASVPFSRQRGFWLLTAGCVMFLGSLLSYASIQLGNQKLTERIASLEQREQQRRRALASPRPAIAADDPSTLRFAAAARELSLPWDDLFHAIETARMESISILSIEPEVASRTVRITAQAVTYTEALGFVDRLSTRPPISAVVLASHQPDPPQSDGPMKFVIDANWRQQ